MSQKALVTSIISLSAFYFYLSHTPPIPVSVTFSNPELLQHYDPNTCKIMKSKIPYVMMYIRRNFQFWLLVYFLILLSALKALLKMTSACLCILTYFQAGYCHFQPGYDKALSVNWIKLLFRVLRLGILTEHPAKKTHFAEKASRTFIQILWKLIQIMSQSVTFTKKTH